MTNKKQCGMCIFWNNCPIISEFAKLCRHYCTDKVKGLSIPSPKEIIGKERLPPIKIILLSSFLALIVGILFAIIQYVGETIGVLPIIYVRLLNWGHPGDSIIAFAIGFLSSVFIGSMFVLFIIRKQII